MAKKLKLYVWENVLHDYTSGVMFALAESPDHARDLIAKKLSYYHDDMAINPKEVKEAEGFYVYGGG